jgi:pimeloyl-ACP methyl ester carboxylesterase
MSVDVRGVVYMLHGWAQNVHVFSNRARRLTKRLNKEGYRVVFLQGPHRLPPVVATSTSAGAGEDNDDNDSSSFSREYAYTWFHYDAPCDGDNKVGDQSAAISRSQPPVLRPSPTGDFRGMDASLAFLRNELRADRNEFREKTTRTDHQQDAALAAIPPFFLFGFSQGAVLVHKVATLACGSGGGDNNYDGIDGTDTDASGCDSRGPWADVQKCILVSGFSFTTSIRLNMGGDIYKSNDDDHDDHRTESRQISGTVAGRRTMPSFHVVGRKDSRVSPHLTLELHSLEPCFDERENHPKILWEHDRGHVVPQNREFCNRLLGFLAVP